MIDRHSYEQVHLKVEPKSFLYEFLNSGDPLYPSSSKTGKLMATCKQHKFGHFSCSFKKNKCALSI